ncbi:hypothetical protein Bbelb_367630 [Branchiostoma belcheri]|nr:hypothetical protein Bbelb_367630 [Branchiostoma belcheri]
MPARSKGPPGGQKRGYGHPCTSGASGRPILMDFIDREAIRNSHGRGGFSGRICRGWEVRTLLEKPRFQEFPVPHTPVKFAVSWSRPWISGLRVYGPGYFLTLPDSCSPCTCTEIYAPHTWRVLGSG